MSVKDILKAMTTAGRRSAKKDLFRQPGGYREVLSAEPNGKPCFRWCT
jgi:hypothetical protein